MLIYKSVYCHIIDDRNSTDPRRIGLASVFEANQTSAAAGQALPVSKIADDSLGNTSLCHVFFSD